MDLHPGEEMVFDGHPSWRAVLTFYVAGVMVVAVLVAIAALVGAPALAIVVATVALGVMVLVGLVKRQATRYVITSERLHIRHGILSKRTQETRIQRVQNVNTEQPLFQRVLQVGTVDFDTAGTDDSEFRFVGVANPDEVVRAVDKAQREAAASARDARARARSRRPAPRTRCPTRSAPRGCGSSDRAPSTPPTTPSCSATPASAATLWPAHLGGPRTPEQAAAVLAHDMGHCGYAAGLRPVGVSSRPPAAGSPAARDSSGSTVGGRPSVEVLYAVRRDA